MKNWWWKFFQSRGLDKKALLKSILGMLGIKFLLWVFPITKVKQLLELTLPRHSASNMDVLKLACKRLEYFWPSFFSCLPQALWIKWCGGSASRIKVIFGVRKQPIFESHAWCENEGEPFFLFRPNEGFKKIWEW